jgi:TolB-like protein
MVSVESRVHRSGPDHHFEAIAVLPFESLSTSPDQQYMADGLTEALITNLGETPPLRVIARTSVSRYVKSKKPIGKSPVT